VQQVADIKPLNSSDSVDERAFADLIKPLIAPGFRLAFAMMHDAAAAEDAVQEACFTAWRKVASIRDHDRLRSWFLGVVANKCRNARRQRWVAGVTLGLPEQLTVVSQEERAMQGADLRRAVGRLRHDDRLVVVLFFYLDLPLEEVAAIAGTSVAAARARLYRSIGRLRPDLEIQEALQ
jgi:RNA polymerase sigma-70 factor (ECF subfamily)